MQEREEWGQRNAIKGVGRGGGGEGCYKERDP